MLEGGARLYRNGKGLLVLVALLLWCSLHTLQLLGVSDYLLLRIALIQYATPLFRQHLLPTLLIYSIKVSQPLSTLSVVSTHGLYLARDCPIMGFPELSGFYFSQFNLTEVATN